MRAHTGEVGPGFAVVLLHEGAGIDEEEVHLAARQLHLEGPVAVPPPIPGRQIAVHLHVSAAVLLSGKLCIISILGYKKSDGILADCLCTSLPPDSTVPQCSSRGAVTRQRSTIKQPYTSAS